MRLEGQSKLGYYPTPPEMVKLIRRYLKFPEGRFYALDPCCGEGTALNLLVEGTNSKTYGVELDKHRATEAKDKLDLVINDAIENVAITEGNYSMLFLNPPYDWDENGERKETMFLAETSKYLMPGGILIFIIPSVRTYDVWDVLTTNFENIVRLDFPDRYYEAYTQIVLIATKKKQPGWSADQSYKEYRILGEDIEQEYKVPPTKGNIATFTSIKLSNIDGIFTNTVWESFNRMVEEAQVSSSSPLLPLRQGHISLLLACGYLDGQVGGHVAKGTVIEDMITESAGDRIKEKTYLKACVKILDREGNIKTLS